jgi:sugar lactone lactonase YvrE
MSNKQKTKHIPVFTTLIALSFFLSCSSNDDNPTTLKNNYDLTLQGLYPESIDLDLTNKRFIVSSFNKGKVFSLSATGNLSEFITDEHFVAASGVFTDEKRNRLIALSGDAGVSEQSAEGGAGAGMVAYAGIYNLKTGTLIKSINLKTLTPEAGAFPNDIAVDDDGNIFITDSFSPVIYKIDASYNATIFATDPLFQPSPGAFGLNGIAVHPGGYLLVSKTDDGKLFKISLSDATQITTVEGIVIPAIDGIELTKDNNSLIAVENGLGDGKVYELKTSNNWQSASGSNEKIIGKEAFPTCATLNADGEIFILSTTHLGVLLTGDKSQSTFNIQKLTF